MRAAVKKKERFQQVSVLLEGFSKQLLPLELADYVRKLRRMIGGKQNYPASDETPQAGEEDLPNAPTERPEMLKVGRSSIIMQKNAYLAFWTGLD